MKLWQKQAVNIFYWLFRALIAAILNSEEGADHFVDRSEDALQELNAKRAEDA